MAHEPLKWYGDQTTHSPAIKALADARGRATLEGHRYQQMQATIAAIDQYAKATLANYGFSSTDHTELAEGLKR